MHEMIPHTLEGEIINQRIKDGYVNATAMCKAAGKRFFDYHRLDTTQAFLDALFSEAGIPASEQIQTVKGGFPDQQGTWVHPKVAIHLAQWLSARFAVQVTTWVYDWMSRGIQPTRAPLPFHLERYVLNYQNVPRGYFSVLTEMTIALIAPLEMEGYTLPERMWPDISEGRMFAKWLRDRGFEPNGLPTYTHLFADGRKPVQARAYPEYLLPDFRAHFRNIWLPLRAAEYFRERDKAALTYLPKLLPAPNKMAS
ncbi:KilA-N domain-containing protein [Rhodomicrobium sp. Az07]|nr:KilA-N domain-containing protein [Rhodomicrobium sp. Az07]